MQRMDSPSGEKSIIVQEFLIAFLDVLGQRGELRDLLTVPTNEEELTRTTATLKRTLGFVTMVRDSFRILFTQYNEPSQFAKSLPDRERMLLKELCRSEISFYGFSDSFVVAIPLGTQDDHCTQINGVYAALLAACWIQFVCLFREHALRGGIDVGVGVQLEGGEVYGAALERAYTLESEVADYPRVAVGNELIRYLEYVRDEPATTDPGRVARLTAARCLRFITEDTDGRPILDFLGDAFREASSSIVTPDMIKKTFKFVTNECDRWAASGNTKLASRYERLREYFEAHKIQWGL